MRKVLECGQHLNQSMPSDVKRSRSFVCADKATRLSERERELPGRSFLIPLTFSSLPFSSLSPSLTLVRSRSPSLSPSASFSPHTLPEFSFSSLLAIVRYLPLSSRTPNVHEAETEPRHACGVCDDNDHRRPSRSMAMCPLINNRSYLRSS